MGEALTLMRARVWSCCSQGDGARKGLMEKELAVDRQRDGSDNAQRISIGGNPGLRQGVPSALDHGDSSMEECEGC